MSLILSVGWQARWFKLEMPLGVLSYYRSEDEVGQSSRGSLKMACCDIGGWLYRCGSGLMTWILVTDVQTDGEMSILLFDLLCKFIFY